MNELSWDNKHENGRKVDVLNDVQLLMTTPKTRFFRSGCKMNTDLALFQT